MTGFVFPYASELAGTLITVVAKGIMLGSQVSDPGSYLFRGLSDQTDGLPVLFTI